jgi:hypothetical protein
MLSGISLTGGKISSSPSRSSGRVRRFPGKSLPNYRLPMEALVVLIVGLTGHLGGFLSGVNGSG